MKFLVDILPESKGSCPFSYWKIYPPIIERSGDYYCHRDDLLCNLDEDNFKALDCRWLCRGKIVLGD